MFKNPLIRLCPQLLRRYGKITKRWTDSLKIPHLPEDPHEERDYTLEEVAEIIALPTSRTFLRDFRYQAGIAMLFASGMRIGALISMPILAFDLTAHPPAVKQFPTLGVRTKFNKAATTFLIPHPTLLGIIKEWDDLVRTQLPGKALWYAALNADGTALRGDEESPRSRMQRLRAGLKRFCERANIPYRRPHLLRHGHAGYVRQHSRHPRCREVISANLMHSPKDVTGVYLRPTKEIVREVYNGLSTTSEHPQQDIETKILLLNIQQQLYQVVKNLA